MTISRLIIATVAISFSCRAAAAPLVLYPVQTGAETVRFLKGVPTLTLDTPSGAVQITPLPFDRGHVAVGVAVYNKGAQPINFGIENISATFNGLPVPVLSSAELQRRAKNRATWAKIGVALLAGAAAYGASQAYTTSTANGVLFTPRGAYSWTSTYRDNSAAVLGTAAAAAAGTAGIVAIQNRLDYTLANLANEIIQTTTIDPDSSYGGRVIIERDNKAKSPFDFRIVMSVNGVEYPFVFRVTKEGTNVPPPFIVAQAPVQTAAPEGSAVTTAPSLASPDEAVAFSTTAAAMPAVMPAAATLAGPGESVPPGPPRATASTVSGYCLDVPRDYVGTGSTDKAALSSATPACWSIGRN